MSDSERPGVSDSERLGPGVSGAHSGSESAPLPSAASVLCAPKRRREDGGSDGGGADGGGDVRSSVAAGLRERLGVGERPGVSDVAAGGWDPAGMFCAVKCV